VLGEQGADVLAHPLAQLMTRKVVTSALRRQSFTIHGAMIDGQVPPRPGDRQDQVVGIISIGYFVQHRPARNGSRVARLARYIQTA